ncbi:MAG: (2Fe-2S)-binding protein [Bacillota bacterium]
MNDGALSVNGVKKRTRACMGMCQGRVCQTLIREILAKEKGLKIQSIETSTSRTPDRPVLLADII